MLYLQNQWMDFKNLNGVWKLTRFCITCIELILNFCLIEFRSQFEFFFYFDFQMRKNHLKRFSLKTLFTGDYSSTFYLFDGKA